MNAMMENKSSTSYKKTGAKCKMCTNYVFPEPQTLLHDLMYLSVKMLECHYSTLEKFIV